MNRGLKINVEEIEKEHEEQMNDEKEESQQSGQQSYYEEEGSQEQQQQHLSEHVNSQEQEQAAQEVSGSVSHHYDNVQTFGNHKSSKKQRKIHPIKHENILKEMKQRQFLLPETPIEQSYDSSKRQLTVNRYSDDSNIDEQINRIVCKVMKYEPVGRTMMKGGYQKEVQKIKKIDRINKELLSQNAQIIGQINDLQKKLAELNSRFGNRNKVNKTEKSVSCFSDKDLMKTLKKYRQKMEKALQLNDKLSSRLITEKSKSRIITNTQRSMINKIEVEKEEIGAISTIRSQSIRDDSKRDKKRSLNITDRIKEQNFCDKCCKEIKKEEKISDRIEKGAIYSPVLQVKDYRIGTLKGDVVQNLGVLKELKKMRNTYCQANLDEELYIQEEMQLQRKEKELLSVIDRNRRKIQEYQTMLFKLVDIN